MQWQSQLGRKNIDRADWQQAEHSGGAGQTIDYFIDRPVAASSDDSLEAFIHRVPCEEFGFAWISRRSYRTVAGQ